MDHCQLFNMLSRLVIAFLPTSKCLLISWLQSSSAVILEPPRIKSVTVSIVSLSICHEMMGPDPMILAFQCWVLSQLFYSPLSLSSRGSLVPLCCLRVVLPAYLRLLIFLLAILILAWDSSNLVFHMIYSSDNLNKQGDNIQPWQAPFPIWNQSIVSCAVLTVSPWPAHRFLRRQVRCSGIYNSLRIFHSLLEN